MPRTTWLFSSSNRDSEARRHPSDGFRLSAGGCRVEVAFGVPFAARDEQSPLGSCIVPNPVSSTLDFGRHSDGTTGTRTASPNGKVHWVPTQTFWHDRCSI